MVSTGEPQMCMSSVTSSPHPPRSLTLHLEVNLALSPTVGRRELAAQGAAMVLPGRGHVEGHQAVDARGLKLLECGGGGAGRVLALPPQGEWLLRARVGSGAVEIHLHALTQLSRSGNGGHNELLSGQRQEAAGSPSPYLRPPALETSARGTGLQGEGERQGFTGGKC